jgi:hypothetical protein
MKQRLLICETAFPISHSRSIVRERAVTGHIQIVRVFSLISRTSSTVGSPPSSIVMIIESMIDTEYDCKIWEAHLFRL